MGQQDVAKVSITTLSFYLIANNILFNLSHNKQNNFIFLCRICSKNNIDF